MKCETSYSILIVSNLQLMLNSELDVIVKMKIDNNDNDNDNNNHYCYNQYYQYHIMEINFGSVCRFGGLAPPPPPIPKS